MRRPRRPRAGEAGAAALELGLVVPIVIMMVFGIIQYGYLFWALQTASATAREATRSLVVGTDEGCVLDRAEAMARGPAIGAVPPTAVPTYRDGNGTVVGQPVEGGTVTVAVGFQTLDLGIPLLPVPDNANVTQEQSARVENVPAIPLSC